MPKNVFPENSGSAVRVGYALNAKKMRKSTNTPSSEVFIDEEYGAEIKEEVTTISAKKTVTEWSGGGLADIIKANEINLYPDNVRSMNCNESSSVDCIQFIQWDYNHNISTAVVPSISPQNSSSSLPYHVIIHKLTEDIHNSDKYEQLCLKQMNLPISYTNDGNSIQLGDVLSKNRILPLSPISPLGDPTLHLPPVIPSVTSSPTSLIQQYRQSHEKIAALRAYLKSHPGTGKYL